MRNAARQTSSVGAQARSVNPRAGTRSKSAEGYPPSEPRSTLRNPSNGSGLAAVGRPGGRSSHTDGGQVRSIGGPSLPVVHHSERTCDVGDGAPEGDRLLAGGDPHPAAGEDVEELLHQGAVVTQERGLRDVQRPGQALQRLDRGCDVSVLVATQPRLRDPGDLLQVRLRVPGLDPRGTESLSERTLVGHLSPPSSKKLLEGESIPMRNPTA